MHLTNSFNAALARSKLKDGSGGAGLVLWALFRIFRKSLLLNAIPRLMGIVFRYSQPILINSTIRYISDPVTENDEAKASGFQLILAAFIIYVGSGVSCLIAVLLKVRH